jgi:DNA-binding transcriptional regulator GbsR (MarR family)
MRSNTISKLENVFIELGGKLCDIIGWRRVIGQIYMLLYVSDASLSLDEIVERINMSKSTVWASITKLQRLCAVTITENIGKKCYYTAERDFNVIFKNGIIPELSSKLLFAGSYFEQAEKALADIGQDTKNNAKTDKYHAFLSELARQRDILDFFQKQLPLLIDTNKSA